MGRKEAMTVVRNGTTYSGTSSDLANLFRALKLEEEGNKPPSPSRPKLDLPNDTRTRRRCIALKASGDRCKHNETTTTINADGLCPSHHNWITHERPTV